METSTLIICQVLFEKLLDEVYEVRVNVLLKLHINSCGRNINIYYDVWSVLLIQFEVLSQPLPFYLHVANTVDVVLCSHKWLNIFTIGSFFWIA